MIALIRQYLAIRRLNRLVRKRRQSFAIEQYRRKRKAALRHEPKVSA